VSVKINPLYNINKLIKFPSDIYNFLRNLSLDFKINPKGIILAVNIYKSKYPKRVINLTLFENFSLFNIQTILKHLKILKNRLYYTQKVVKV